VSAVTRLVISGFSQVAVI